MIEAVVAGLCQPLLTADPPVQYRDLLTAAMGPGGMPIRQYRVFTAVAGLECALWDVQLRDDDLILTELWPGVVFHLSGCVPWEQVDEVTRAGDRPKYYAGGSLTVPLAHPTSLERALTWVQDSYRKWRVDSI